MAPLRPQQAANALATLPSTRGGGVRDADLPVAKAGHEGAVSPEPDLHRRPDPH